MPSRNKSGKAHLRRGYAYRKSVRKKKSNDPEKAAKRQKWLESLEAKYDLPPNVEDDASQPVSKKLKEIMEFNKKLKEGVEEVLKPKKKKKTTESNPSKKPEQSTNKSNATSSINTENANIPKSKLKKKMFYKLKREKAKMKKLKKQLNRIKSKEKKRNREVDSDLEEEMRLGLAPEEIEFGEVVQEPPKIDKLPKKKKRKVEKTEEEKLRERHIEILRERAIKNYAIAKAQKDKKLQEKLAVKAATEAAFK